MSNLTQKSGSKTARRQAQPKYSKLLQMPEEIYRFVVAESLLRNKSQTHVINCTIDEFRHRRASEWDVTPQKFADYVREGHYRNKAVDYLTPEQLANNEEERSTQPVQSQPNKGTN